LAPLQKRAQQLFRSAAANFCRATNVRAFCSLLDKKFHGIQNWVGEGSYKTRIWFNQNGRSGGFNFCHELFGLGVFFVAYHSVRAFLRQFELATRRELPVLPERRSRHFYFFTVDGSKLLPSGESVTFFAWPALAAHRPHPETV
jgi:hypothetical protein